MRDKRVDGISAIRDESDREGMRIVIEVKRDANANVILNQLYKYTQMQESFCANMIALVDNREPRLPQPARDARLLYRVPKGMY